MSEALFCVCTCCVSLCKAFSAVVILALDGCEGNRILFAAICTDDSRTLSLRSACVFTSLSASLATLGLIYKAFFCVEFLLSCGKNEFFAAIFANECLVFVHWFLPRFEIINLSRGGIAPPQALTSGHMFSIKRLQHATYAPAIFFRIRWSALSTDLIETPSLSAISEYDHALR